MFNGSIEEAASEAEKLLCSIAPGAWCVAQEWDARIDCYVKLPNGSVVGEMVGLTKLTENRVREAGERLRQRSEGIDVPLADEIRPPFKISREL